MHPRFNTHTLAVSAVIGAAYAAMTMALAPISYGAVQLRVSEALCILPYFIPGTACGLFAGCIIANLITGNVFDIVFGSLATLGAALVTARMGKLDRAAGAPSVRNQLLACFQPVIFNALIVGAVITGAYEGQNIFRHPGVFGLNAFWVGLGETVVLFALGYPLMRWLPGRKFFRDVLEKTNPQ